MNAQQQQQLSITGQMVQGHPKKENTTGHNNKPLTYKDGSPRTEFFLGVAVAKTDPAFNALWVQLQQIAQRDFPGGESKKTDFAWKVTNGDDAKVATKEGFPGHWVFKFTNGFPIRTVTKGGEQELNSEEGLKPGDYVRVFFYAKGNGDGDKSGIYLNPHLVEVVGYGQEIVGGPDAKAVIAEVGAAVLPAGASATPVAPANMPAGAMPGPGGMPGPTSAPPASNMPGAPGAAAGPPASGAAAPQLGAPGMPSNTPGVTPNTGFLNPRPGYANAAAYVTPAPPVAPGNPPAKTMTEKAAGMTYDQFIAQGWTDAQLITHGYLTVDDIPH